MGFDVKDPSAILRFPKLNDDDFDNLRCSKHKTFNIRTKRDSDRASWKPPSFQCSLRAGQNTQKALTSINAQQNFVARS